MKKNFILICGLVIIQINCLPLTANAEVAVVVHPNNPSNSISADQATRIFLGKESIMPDGNSVVPIDQAAGSPSRNEFYSKVVNKTPMQLNAYWSRLIFTGKGQPPKAVEDNDDVLDRVGEDPNLIGYLNSSTVDDTVKVILLVH